MFNNLPEDVRMIEHFFLSLSCSNDKTKAICIFIEARKWLHGTRKFNKYNVSVMVDDVISEVTISERKVRELFIDESRWKKMGRIFIVQTI